jgi:hypothetical protein
MTFKHRAWLSLWWHCSVAFAIPSAASASPLAITEIALERDCAGCSTGSSLVLRRDGTAILTLLGKARQGTEDRVSRGHIRTLDFDALARLALAQGFFALNDSYDDPEVQDGLWSTTRIVHHGVDKRVFQRDNAGPAALRTLQAAIEELRARIQFIQDR